VQKNIYYITSFNAIQTTARDGALSCATGLVDWQISSGSDSRISEPSVLLNYKISQRSLGNYEKFGVYFGWISASFLWFFLKDKLIKLMKAEKQ